MGAGRKKCLLLRFVKRIFPSIVMMLLFPLWLIAQESRPRSWELKGYLDDLQMVQFSEADEPWTFDNQLNNRLDFTWSPAGWFRTGAGMRNRFIFGQSLSENPDAKGSLTFDPGLVNMTWDLGSSASYLLMTEIDRAWVSFIAGRAEMTIGRQRINWGQTTVWNPDDIFNTYSYYDIDYPERPGSDALRLQVFPSSASTVEMAASWNYQGKITVAGLGRFNVKGYDIQFLAGLVGDQDWAVGTGWSGNLAGAAFRGEAVYYQPKENFSDTSGVLLATVGADYTFRNSLALAFQVFYNQLPPGYRPDNLLSLYQAPLSPKTLSFAEWNIFLQGSYPVTPLFNVSLGLIYFPDLDGFYIGPTFGYNLEQNIGLDLFVQYFDGRFRNMGPLNDQIYHFKSFMAALRLKWSFKI